MGRQSYKKDPLAEFERLYKMWVRTKKKIKEQTFPHEKEMEFKAYEKKVNKEWEREVDMQEEAEKKAKEASVFSKSSASPPPRGVAFGSSARQNEEAALKRNHSQQNTADKSFHTSNLSADEPVAFIPVHDMHQ